MYSGGLDGGGMDVAGRGPSPEIGAEGRFEGYACG
jgi:hypothetical protein